MTPIEDQTLIDLSQCNPADWLKDYLSAGQCRSIDAKRAAAQAGISERTLLRACRILKVQITQAGFPRVTYWALPGQLNSLNGASKGRMIVQEHSSVIAEPPVSDDAGKHESPLAGKWFHSFSHHECGCNLALWQGQIISAISEGWYLVQTYEWISGCPWTQKIVAIRDMVTWDIYDDHKEMREHYTHISGRREKHNRDCDPS